MEQRMQGDDHALLGWRNTIEVAMATQEVLQAEAAKNAARFFQPFREAGKLKLQRRKRSSTTHFRKQSRRKTTTFLSQPY